MGGRRPIAKPPRPVIWDWCIGCDYIHPRRRMGWTDPANCRYLCRECRSHSINTEREGSSA